MSKTSHKRINCKCGSTFTITIWDSINININPELKDKFLKDEINIGVCNECGEVYKVIAPILYSDVDLRLMVWVLPKQWEKMEGVEELKNRYLKSLKEDNTPLSKELKVGYVFAVVFGVRELQVKLDKFKYQQT